MITPIKELTSALKSAHRRSLSRLAIILVLVLCLWIPFSGTVPVMAQSTNIYPSSGPPGTSVTVSGSGFNSGDTYQITFASGTIYEKVLSLPTTISGSSFSQVIMIPSVPSGQYTILVSSGSGNSSPLFQVTPIIELNATSGYVGDTVTVNGRGFRANASVNVWFNNTVILTVPTNTYGELASVDFQVPALRRGDYAIIATDSLAAAPQIAFTINPHIAINPQQGPVGSTINISGSGFSANSSITIFWDGQTANSSPITSNSSGSFTASVAVPISNRGGHTILARDNSFISDTASFLVEPNITINPASGASGVSVALAGQGFRSNITVVITFSGTTISTRPDNIITDNNGSFSAAITIPGVVSGDYVITANDGVYSASATFSAISNITLNPASGSVGTKLLVNGSGFTPGGEVALSYDSQPLTTVAADSNGSFSASFSVPASKAGQHSVTARDLTTQGITATAIYSMESTPPPGPVLLLPQDGSMTSTQPRFSWSAVSDPSGVTYDLQVSQNAGFSQLLLYHQALTQPEYQVTQSEAFQLTKKSNPYYWRVRAVDGASNASGWTSPRSFYTQDSTPPGVPLTLSPLNDAQVDLQPDFKWSAVSDPSGVTYNLQIAWDTGFSRTVLLKQGLTQTEYQLGQSEKLQLTKKSAPYYWRVRAVDGAGNTGDWSTPALLYTEDSTAPPSPVPLSPDNGAQEKGTILFRWTSVSDPSGVTYTLEIAQDSDFVHLVFYKEGLDKAEYQLAKAEQLSPSQGNPPSPYYWRVKASDGAQNDSNWSSINTLYIVGFWQLLGWPLYIIFTFAGIFLVVIGIFIGMRIRQPTPSKK